MAAMLGKRRERIGVVYLADGGEVYCVVRTADGTVLYETKRYRADMPAIRALRDAVKWQNARKRKIKRPAETP